MLNRARAAVLILAALTLAACGSIHPGDAAVVDGHSISMTKFDKSAAVYCKLQLGEGAKGLSNADVRRQTIAELVMNVVARDLAREKGVTPAKQEYVSTDEREAIVAHFGDEADTALDFIRNQREIIAIAVALGEHSSGVVATVENQSELSQAGQAEIIRAFKDHDVKFAPRFGLSSSLKDVGPTGSLSVAEIDFEAPVEDELPADQRCA